MNTIKSLVALSLLALTACNKTENSTTTQPDAAATEAETLSTKPLSADEEQEQIEETVKSMYHWVEATQAAKQTHGWKMVIKDSLVTGYDMADHKLYLNDLRKTGFFAEEFIQNMDKIVNYQDKELRSGKAEWFLGEFSPFDADTSPWCNCQDEPTDKDAYSQIKFHFIKADPSKAELYWNWEGFGKEVENMHYKIRTVKENGKWKIAWMQGWDYKLNTTY